MASSDGRWGRLAGALTAGALAAWLIMAQLSSGRTAVLSPVRAGLAYAQGATLTLAVYLPLLIVASEDIRVFLVGFDPSGGEQYEHIHLINCDTKPVTLTGWMVRSPATGDVYTFSNYVAQPGCGGQVQFTVNTHVTGFEDPSKGLFTWSQPLSREEWPNSGGSAEVYNAIGGLVFRCNYSPSDLAAPGDAYCRR